MRISDNSGGEWNDYISRLNNPATSTPAAPEATPAPAVNTTNNGLFLVDPEKAFQGDQGASQLLGDLSRAQWDDWKVRFRPQIEQLADIATDNTLPGQSAAQAGSAVSRSFGNAQRALQLQQQGLGLQLDGTERAAQSRKFGLAEAATGLAAANQARVATQDMQQATLAGNAGLQTMPSDVLK